MDRLDRGEDGDLRRRYAEGQRQVDGVLADIDLVFERRRDVDGRVGDDQHLVIGRDVHDEHVTDAALHAQARLLCDHRTEQLIGVQAALHQNLGLSLPNQFDGLDGSRVAVRNVDDPAARKVDPAPDGDLLDLDGRSDENRRDEPFRASLDGAGQGRLLARMHDRGGDRIKDSTPEEQLLVLSRS